MVDDDGETIAVLGAGRISALNATALAWQAEVRRDSSFFSLYSFYQFLFSSPHLLQEIRMFFTLIMFCFLVCNRRIALNSVIV